MDTSEFQPPLPLSEDFWLDYQEGADELASYAYLFSRDVKALSRLQAGGGDIEALHAAHYGFSFLNALAATAAPSFRLDGSTGAVEEVRESPGLLASFALMVLWDFEAGRKAIECDTCGRNFVSDEPKAKYCSPKCRNTAQRRRTRESRTTNPGTEVGNG